MGQHAAKSNSNWMYIFVMVLIVISVLIVWLWPTDAPSDFNDSNKKREIVTATSSSTTDECQALPLSQAQTLVRATTTLDQWELHINAMNQLVAGKISLNRAVKFWTESEESATSNLFKFFNTLTEVRDLEKRCSRQTQCSDLNRTLKHAEITAQTWHHHIMDMQALMKGEVTPTQAATAWEEKWKIGNRQLKQYQKHAQSLRC